ncbi:MAG TPA: DUF3823 domain-containing protein [Chitinophaga sp.]|uniref:DUF3823 domain-containing protein n=1 Tax=Chitinophaga sp. TaxID=1869181 RepID=UPI002CCC887E|nr:DUF3823 domain-containing protein [Chitinophaga sp.]HVI44846.1 DUF3823 domain-containing protein [Chitinophaga sp.]
MNRIQYLLTIGILATATAWIAGCKKDNYKSADARIYGTVVDETTGQPVPAQAVNGAKIRVSQLDYSSAAPVPQLSSVKPDGTYENAAIFSGRYEVSATGPFYPVKPAVVTISGNQQLDIKVKPFLLVTATVGEVTGNSITVKYVVKSNANAQQIARVAAVAGTTAGVDVNYYLQRIVVNTEAIDNTTIGNTTYTAVFTDLKPGTTYFIRAAGRTVTSADNPSSLFNYTPVMEIKTK